MQCTGNRAAKFNNYKAKIEKKRAGKDEGGGTEVECITVQRLVSHVEGKYQKYTRYSALTTIPLGFELNISNIKEACKRQFKCEDMDCDILVGKGGPSLTAGSCRDPPKKFEKEFPRMMKLI